MSVDRFPYSPADDYSGVSSHDEALNNHHLDVAATEVVGKMHDFQGIAPTSHNSGDLTVIGPVHRGDGDHNSEVFGGGFGSVS